MIADLRPDLPKAEPARQPLMGAARERRRLQMAKRMELALSILVLFLLVGCAGSPTATPGLGGTEVAV
jgi:hypothetical protein